MNVQTLLGIIAILLFLILWEISRISARLKERFPTAKEQDYEWSQPRMAQGGTGVVVPGCPACRKRIQTVAQFLDHLTDDVLPSLLDKLALT
jgi:hypothetical protein